MPNLEKRSEEFELLDQPGIAFADIRQNMIELNRINSLLGGHKVTIAGMAAFVGNDDQELHICEIGSGGGDNLKALAEWLSEKGIPASFTGIDIKQECIDFAAMQYPALNAKWICSDYKEVTFTTKPDVIFSSLFCHHFKDAELPGMLRWMQAHATRGFFINDLHRHPMPYFSIKWLTALFSRSYLVKHDAPLSVARGFKKREWIKLLHEADMEQHDVQWKWAFRHLVLVKK